MNPNFFKRIVTMSSKEKEDAGWFSRADIDKRWETKRLKISFTVRSAKGCMGRFGGGWNWKIGVQWGSSTVIFSLLVAELVIRRKPKKDVIK